MTDKRTKPTEILMKRPTQHKGELKPVGGSASDDWNHRIAVDPVAGLWLKNSDPQTRDQQFQAALAGLMGIAPKDELEGMLVAQLLASHYAAMECYRRAMIGEQTFEGRREMWALPIC